MSNANTQRKLAFSPARVWNSTVGLKFAMAGSGVVLVAFVLGHMVGNLQIFLGQDVYNDYAKFMQGLGAALWIVRLSLLALIAIHIAAGLKLKARNVGARRSPYAAGLRTRATSWHARVMAWSGVVALAYIIYHIAHFTFEAVSYEPLIDAMGRRDIYTNFVRSFQNPVNVIIYVIGNLAIASHLSHGVSSMFHTLGISTGPSRRIFDYIGPVFAIIVAIGNLSMPLACFFGLLEA